MKRVLSLILVLSLVLGMFPATFAEETAATMTAGETLMSYGLLEGDNGDLKEAKGINRIEMMAVIARLLGVYDEAMGYTLPSGFTDVTGDHAWGASLVGYAKSAGWTEGVSPTEFAPAAALTEQQAATFILRALGYVDTDEVKVYDIAIEKATELGIKAEVAADTAVIRSEVFTMALEALNVKIMGTEQKLGAKLEIAVYSTPVVEPSVAKMTDAKAIDATTATVTLDAKATVTAADFTVVDSAKKEMAISAVTLADDSMTVVLTVAEMTVGAKYMVTYADMSKDIVPTIKDDEAKPEISAAEAVTGTLVRVTFETRNLNLDTLVAGNLSIDNDAKVLSLKVDTDEMDKDANVNNTVVLLEVSGLKAGKAYTIKSSNVASYEGAVADVDDSKATFAGKDADDDAPELAGAVSVAGYKVLVTFTEDVTLDEASAIDISNYSITPELAITAAEITKNEVGGDTTVTLTTADQKAGTAYTLKVDNISDGTNVMKAAEDTVFAGKEKATNQEVSAAAAVNATKVEVTFKYDANETALDISNYTINNDIKVTAAVFKEDTSETDDLNQKIVQLTTSAMKAGVAYEITVGTGVQDELGQGLEESTKETFAGKDVDNEFDTDVTAKSKDKTTIEVTFAEEVDRTTATSVANYSIDGGLGYPSKVSLNTAGTIATLTVAEQTSGKSYTMKLNNIMDKANNTVKANTEVTFTGKGDVVTDVRVESAVALSKTKIKVTFNQDITAGTPTYTLTLHDGTAITGLTSVTGATVAGGGVHTNTNIVTVAGVDLTDANVYKITCATLGGSAGYLNTHILSTVSGKTEDTFVGSSDTAAYHTVSSIEAIDTTHIKVTFTEELTGSAVIAGVTGSIFSDSDYSVAAKDASDAVILNAGALATVSVSTDKKSATYTLAKALKDSTVYYFEFGSFANFVAADTAMKPYKTGATTVRESFVTGDLTAAADVKLDISSAVMLDANTIELKFNYDLDDTANIDESKIVLGKADTLTANETGITVKFAEFMDETTVRLYFTGEAKLDNTSGIHYVKVLASSNIATKVGTIVTFKSEKDIESFAKNAADNSRPTITLVEPQGDSVVKVTTSERVVSAVNAAANSVTALVPADFVLYNADTNATIVNTDYTVTAVTGDDVNKVFYITLINDGVLLEGANYQLGFAGTVFGFETEAATAAKVYAPATSETDNSMNFGGSAALADVATANFIIANLGFNPNTGVVNMTTAHIETSVLDRATNTTAILSEVITATSKPAATATGEYKFVNTAFSVTGLTYAPVGAPTNVAGDTVYYRYKDVAGNWSDWLADGVLPTIGDGSATIALGTVLKTATGTTNGVSFLNTGGGGNDTLAIAGAQIPATGTVTTVNFNANLTTAVADATTGVAATSVGANEAGAIVAATNVTITYTVTATDNTSVAQAITVDATDN